MEVLNGDTEGGFTIKAVKLIFTKVANKTTTSAQVGFVINVTVFYKYEGE